MNNKTKAYLKLAGGIASLWATMTLLAYMCIFVVTENMSKGAAFSIWAFFVPFALGLSIFGFWLIFDFVEDHDNGYR